MVEGPPGLSERLTRPEQWALVFLIALVAILAGWRYGMLDAMTRPPVVETGMEER